MSPSFPQNPWPAQTHSPQSPPTSRSKRKRRSAYPPEPRGGFLQVMSRQVIADTKDVAQAKTACMWNSGNDVISCFPTPSTVIPQHQWATFVWNSRRPEITQTNLVDIYLFHGDSLQQIYHWHAVRNPTDQAGTITAQVNDTWFGNNALRWNGQNISYPYYWVITRSDATLDGSEIPQATFTAVQTTYADSVASSMASSSSMAQASASAAARPSVSPGNVQSGLGNSPFPHWAIAVIAVLGFLALAALCILIFLIIRRVRQRRRSSNRNSMGSSSPMMANLHEPHRPSSPLMEGAGLAAVGTKATSSHGHHSLVSHETGSPAPSTEQGPFSGADAAIMADAFRKALRKPDFAGQPVEEGESPPEELKDGILINRELAEEGRDVRSVESARSVTVESGKDGGDAHH